MCQIFSQLPIIKAEPYFKHSDKKTKTKTVDPILGGGGCLLWPPPPPWIGHCLTVIFYTEITQTYMYSKLSINPTWMSVRPTCTDANTTLICCFAANASTNPSFGSQAFINWLSHGLGPVLSPIESSTVAPEIATNIINEMRCLGGDVCDLHAAFHQF